VYWLELAQGTFVVLYTSEFVQIGALEIRFSATTACRRLLIALMDCQLRFDFVFSKNELSIRETTHLDLSPSAASAPSRPRDSHHEFERRVRRFNQLTILSRMSTEILKERSASFSSSVLHIQFLLPWLCCPLLMLCEELQIYDVIVPSGANSCRTACMALDSSAVQLTAYHSL
jgi:hypothetical protein